MPKQSGFTLIEVMIVVGIIAILAAIAMPMYGDYITRGKIQEATSALSDLRVKMEQYYQDNRRYSTTTGGETCGLTGGNLPTVQGARYFTFTCAPLSVNAAGAQAYLITATGIDAQGMKDFELNINESNVKKTMSVKTGWTKPAPDTCWVQRKGGEC